LDLPKDFVAVYNPRPSENYILLFRRKTCSWIEEFLSNRSQKVKIGDIFSPPAKVTSGGPTLFLLYINDLCDMGIESSIFADDVKMYNLSSNANVKKN